MSGSNVGINLPGIPSRTSAKAHVVQLTETVLGDRHIGPEPGIEFVPRVAMAVHDDVRVHSCAPERLLCHTTSRVPRFRRRRRWSARRRSPARWALRCQYQQRPPVLPMKKLGDVAPWALVLTVNVPETCRVAVGVIVLM
jgi:hypothetical protein